LLRYGQAGANVSAGRFAVSHDSVYMPFLLTEFEGEAVIGGSFQPLRVLTPAHLKM